MKILLFGKNGQVGWELQRSLSMLGTLVALDRAGTGSLVGDLAQPEALGATVRQVAPDWIVNAAAYTAVDRAESDQDLAFTVNAQAPAVLAREAARSGCWLLHFSTDYVFDGSGSEPWREDAPTGPLNVYGHSKLEGERAIRASGCHHLILRSSWIYGARGSNFAKTMLRLAQDRDSLRVVDDQIGAPTGADLLADLSAHMVRAARAQAELSGTYHATANGHTSWHGYAAHAIAFAREAGVPIKTDPSAIEPVSSAAFQTVARRPRNSRLDTSKLRDSFGLALPDWQHGVERMVNEVLGR